MINVFNNVNMQSSPAPKLSEGKAIGFRPGHQFRTEIEALAESSGWRITDITRVGMMVFWQDIQAMVLTSPPNIEPEQFEETRALAKLFRSARASKLPIRDILVRALEENLAAQTAHPFGVDNKA